MTVVDAGVVLTALLATGKCAAEAQDQRSQPCYAPELIDLEVGSALRRLTIATRVTATRASMALDDLGILPLERGSHRPLLQRCWALRGSITFHDAAYVALAELLGTPLVTTDERLARAAGRTCRVTVLR